MRAPRLCGCVAVQVKRLKQQHKLSTAVRMCTSDIGVLSDAFGSDMLKLSPERDGDPFPPFPPLPLGDEHSASIRRALARCHLTFGTCRRTDRVSQHALRIRSGEWHLAGRSCFARIADKPFRAINSLPHIWG